MNSPVSEPIFNDRKFKTVGLVAVINYDVKANFNYKDNISGCAIKLASLNGLKKKNQPMAARSDNTLCCYP